MSTTDLVAELVVGGFQTLVWVALLVMVLFGVPTKMPSFGSWVVDAGFVLCVMYTFGTLFDRLWDLILRSTRLDRLARGRPSLSANDLIRQKIVGRDASVASDFINYIRSRMRIARASIFNFALTTIFGSVLAPKLPITNRSDIRIAVLAIGISLTVVAVVAYVSLARAYERSLVVASGTSPH